MRSTARRTVMRSMTRRTTTTSGMWHAAAVHFVMETAVRRLSLPQQLLAPLHLPQHCSFHHKMHGSSMPHTRSCRCPPHHTPHCCPPRSTPHRPLAAAVAAEAAAGAGLQGFLVVAGTAARALLQAAAETVGTQGGVVLQGVAEESGTARAGLQGVVCAAQPAETQRGRRLRRPRESSPRRRETQAEQQRERVGKFQRLRSRRARP